MMRKLSNYIKILCLRLWKKLLKKHQETAFREGFAMKQDMMKSMKCIQSALDEIQAMYPAHKEKTSP